MPAFADLIDGYRRFREKAYPRQQRDYERLVREGQHPRLMLIGCCDSRIDPARIFDVDPGDIFVLRNIAALIPPFADADHNHGLVAALEYAVSSLCVPHIVVMGHGDCGGCKAALDAGEQDIADHVHRWTALLGPDREAVLADKDLSDAERLRAMEHAAVRRSVANLRTYPFIADRLMRDDIRLAGAYFSLPEGELHRLEQNTGAFVPVA